MAICEGYEVSVFAKDVALGARMFELEFLLSSQEDIDVKTICRLILEPICAKLCESAMLSSSRSEEGSGGAASSSLQTSSHTRSHSSAHAVPIILRLAIAGMSRALDQSQALLIIAPFLTPVILKSIVTIQQARFSKIRDAAGFSIPNKHSVEEKMSTPDRKRLANGNSGEETSEWKSNPFFSMSQNRPFSGLDYGFSGYESISSMRSVDSAEELKQFRYKSSSNSPAAKQRAVSFEEDLEAKSPVVVRNIDGIKVDPSTLAAGAKELKVLERAHNLLKMCFTWQKLDRSSFCLLEMSVLSRSRFLITR